jgi:hypothetical protein
VSQKEKTDEKKMFGIIQLTMQTLAFTHGWGRHFFYLDDSQRVKAMEMVFVSEPFGVYNPPQTFQTQLTTP